MAVRTAAWPLVGDASLIHYAVFLLESGWKPYSQIRDINLPGAYLTDWLVMNLLGPGALAERLFDFALTAVSGLAAWWLSPPRYRLAGVFAAAMFFLLHARDGIVQTGQRDWTVALLALLAVGAWLHATRFGAARWYFFAGLPLGYAVLIKPYALLFALPLAVERLWSLRTHGSGRRYAAANKPWLLLGAGLALPIAACALWLLREHALRTFLSSGIAMMRYHASLQRLPAITLAAHGVSGMRLPILLGALLLPFAWRPLRGRAFALLSAEALAGLAYYVAQGKGYAYQRYPFAFFLLELLGLIYLSALSSETTWSRWAASAALGACCLWFAPQAAIRALGYQPVQDQFGEMLHADLQTLGGTQLDGRVQCLDTFSGCLRVLYELRLHQSTGALYDEFLFGPSGNTVVQDSRVAFVQELHAHQPELFIVTPQNYAGARDSYDKINSWPGLAGYLAENYRLCVQRTPSVPQLWEGTPRVPLGYRIYVRRNFSTPCAAAPA